MFVLALSLYNTWNRGVFLLCKITNLLIYSLKFKIEGEIEPYPYLVRVPVEMRAFQTSTAPIVFLLHVVNGVIDELEIITADLTQIDADSIKLEKVEYEVNQEVVVKK